MIDLTGQKFDRLAVQKFAGKSKHGHPLWDCVCDCGNTKRVAGGHLKSGRTKSCGCYNDERRIEVHTKHGHYKKGLSTSIYEIWCSMMQRCYNPKSRRYTDWGGRGIKVCERWHVFENFFEDMGDCPEGMSLDRKNNDGDYCKENCRWATHKEQQNNMRSNVWLTHREETKTVAQWARSLDINIGTLWWRLSKWSVERALTTPVRKNDSEYGGSNN